MKLLHKTFTTIKQLAILSGCLLTAADALAEETAENALVGASQTETVVVNTLVLPEEPKPTPKVEITPIGRVLMDGALYVTPQKEDWKDGTSISEMRLGTILRYGKWFARVELGYNQGTLSARDLYLQYNFRPGSFVRAGNFIHPFGLQAPTSSSLKCTFEEPVPASVFAFAYLIGVMGQFTTPSYYGMFSAHVEPKSINLTPDELNHQGYGLITRQVWRPVNNANMVAQVGVSGSFLSPQTRGTDAPHDGFTLAANFPTKVDRVRAVGVDLDGCRNQIKFSPELLLMHGHMALESQYFFSHIERKATLQSFNGMGFYATLRGQLIGKGYSYNSTEAVIAVPAPGTLDVALGFSYTNLNDREIKGGKLCTYSATLSYYFNKYVLARLNYCYANRWASPKGHTDLNIIQARIQVLF